jgi:hypothetical protein
MARAKYKQKPQFWYAVQYSGTNDAEMLAFCPQCAYDEEQQKLLFNLLIVTPTNWVLEDMAGVFSMMIDSQFKAFFSLDNSPG